MSFVFLKKERPASLPEVIIICFLLTSTTQYLGFCCFGLISGRKRLSCFLTHHSVDDCG